MAGGIFGFDPLQAMLMRVQQQPQNEEQYASGGAVSSMPPPAAPPPAPVAGPSGGGGTGAGGGISSLLASLSGAVGNIASGSGLFGDTSRDAETDPSSGAPLGMVRKANGQRLMNLGVMLLAAGGRQSDDSRARVLASIPGQLGDPANQLNEFAKTRLEMAKTKLIERQMLQEQEASRAIGEWAGGGQAAASTPSAAPASVTPSAVAPVVAAAVPGAIGQQAQAATAAPMRSQPLVVGTPANSTPALASAPVAIPDAHPATPPQTQILDGRPPKPQPLEFGPQTMTNADRLYLKTPNIDTKAKTKYIADRNKEFADTELATPIYRDTQSGMYKQDIYKNGQRISERYIREIPPSLQVSKDEQGSTITEKRAPTGEVIDRHVARDPEVERQAEKSLNILAEHGKDLRTLHDSATTSIDTAKKLDPIIKSVKEDKVYSGAFGPIQRYAVNALASVGGASEAQLNALISTQKVNNITEEAANQFARMYNGAVVTDADRDSARLAIGAILSNDKNTLASALEDMQKNARKKVDEYHSKLDRHEKTLESRQIKDKDLYTSPRIDLGGSTALGTASDKSVGRFNPATGKIERY